ncbi:hypothetical protein FGO68_gene11947 [Halteria grandinella]|uniref:Uncharacterized protein n=1 Tax=Halteria grandinella TaxID=5974 RepID=A0A8J8SYV3_HALGN|nr:hypothetical protein FGO68_gene11947 [Halteria grandinella]
MILQFCIGLLQGEPFIFRGSLRSKNTSLAFYLQWLSLASYRIIALAEVLPMLPSELPKFSGASEGMRINRYSILRFR